LTGFLLDTNIISELRKSQPGALGRPSVAGPRTTVLANDPCEFRSPDCPEPTARFS